MGDKELLTLKETLDWLINKFRFERIIYIVATGFSIVMLLVSALLMIIRKGVTSEILILLFGSTGLIGYSVNRLLKMFDQTLNIIAAAKMKGSDGDG